MQKGRDPDVEVKKGVPLFHVFKGWVQARLVVITATFTYDGSYTPHPPSALPGLAPGRQLVALLANKPYEFG